MMCKAPKKEVNYNKLPEELNVAKVYCQREGHHYIVEQLGKEGVDGEQYINFIMGGRNSDKCVRGITHEQLMEVIIDRLSFFGTNDNEEVIALLIKALHLMNDRTVDRHERGVLGNNGEDYEEKK